MIITEVQGPSVRETATKIPGRIARLVKLPFGRKKPDEPYPGPALATEAPEIGETLSDTSRDVYSRLNEGQKINKEKEAGKNGIRNAEIEKSDLEAQEAILPIDHPLYATVNRITQKIATAEKKLLQRKTFTRKEETDEYSFHITTRDNVNAFTYRRGKIAFLESGIITLFDKYLMEQKGYGLSEDHLAGILAHEISHSDEEAELGFLNEEYCDVQGMTLTAEAGYNPTAMVDVEDFLIWLQEGEDYYKEIDKKNTEKSEKKNAFLPTHPDPKNRKLVLINTLRNKNTVVPNQAKPYTQIDHAGIEDLEGRSLDWQTKAQERMMPLSKEEAMARISQATNINELLEAVRGYHLLKKAFLTKELVQDQDFLDKLTLLEAILTEVDSQENRLVQNSFGEKDNYYEIIRHLTDHYFSYHTGKYGSFDLLIGGMAKNAPGRGDLEFDQMASAIKAYIDSNASGVNLSVKVSEDYIEQTKKMTVEEFKKAKEQEVQRAKLHSETESQRLQDLFAFLMNLEHTPNAARIISGDFSENPELSAKLKDCGINNFGNYIKKLQENFRALDLNPHLKPLYSQILLELYPDTQLLAQKAEQMSPETIRSLLEETRFYRAAIYSSVRIIKKGDGSFMLHDELPRDRYDYSDLMNQIVIDQNLGKIINERLKFIADSMSEIPEERTLIFAILSEEFISRSYGNSVSRAAWALSSSVLHRGSEYAIDGIARFESSGLPPLIERLRVNPSWGGVLLGSYLSGDLLEKSLSGQFANLSKKLAYQFDFVKAYFGETEFARDESLRYERYTPQVKPRDFLGALRLIEKRRRAMPTIGRDVIKEYDSSVNITDAENLPDISAWERLKAKVKTSNYDKSQLTKIIFYKGVSAEEKINYLLMGLENGEFSLDRLFESFRANLYDYRPSGDTYRRYEYENDKIKYDLALRLLRKLPGTPVPQSADVSFFCQNLYLTKLRIRLIEKARELAPPENKNADGVSTEGIDLYDGMTEEQKAAAQLESIFEFAGEGGFINTNIQCKGQKSDGYTADFPVILKTLNFPLSEVRQKVASLLENSGGRYTPKEIDKLTGLAAFCEQPYLYDLKLPDFRTLLASRIQPGGQEVSTVVKIRTDQGFVELDYTKLEDLFKIADAVSRLPESTYKDQCLRKLVQFTECCSAYGTMNKKQEIIVHAYPFKQEAQERISKIVLSGFSRFGLSTALEYDLSEKSTKEEIKRRYIPKSEMYSTDPAEGFYVLDSEAGNVFSCLIQERAVLDERNFYGDITNPLSTALSARYRENPKFNGLPAEKVERIILAERLKMLEGIPASELREALILYSIKSAFDNLENLKNSAAFSLEIYALVNSGMEKAKSAQVRQSLFEMKLSFELGGKVNEKSIKEKFQSGDDFLAYILKYLPEKTAFRDNYIVMATEFFPFKVGGIPGIRELLFADDYGTSKKEVVVQRGGLEFARIMKKDPQVKKKELSQLILWLVDERRQVTSMDQLVKNLSRDEAGYRLIKNLFYPSESYGETPLIDRAIAESLKAGVNIFMTLPGPLKRGIIGEILRRSDPQKFKATISKAMMPYIPYSVQESLNYAGIDPNKLSFNSLLDSASEEESNLKREMFFNLMLGEKGILEEAVEFDSKTFPDRMRNGFRESEMHKFIDDVLEIAFREGAWSEKAKKVTRIASHSFIEALSPTRRAIVLYNLLSEFQKIDFSEKNSSRLRAKIFTVALSSMGLLGAKIGQIDELIPKGWGSEMATLKHNTKSMPKLAVADIFAQEGLSDDYIIETPAGAASTACGYIVRSPSGEKQFVKVVRPEIKVDWKGDFKAVAYMLKCLQETGVLKTETGPIIEQLQRLVGEELEAGREINNVIQYVNQEDLTQRAARRGLRPVNMPLERIGKENQPTEAVPESLMIFEELLEKGEFIELSKLENPDPAKQDYQEIIELRRKLDRHKIHKMIADDFLFRALIIGNWHTDLHGGNILISKSGIVKRIVTDKDLVLIDFGQTGNAEGADKRANAARFFIGMALKDRGEIADAIYEACPDKSAVTPELIRKELVKGTGFKESVTKTMAKYGVDPYLGNFLKGCINVLPYITSLPRGMQWAIIAPYISKDLKGKMRIKLLETVAKRLP